MYRAGRGTRVTRARAVVIGAGIGGLAAAAGLRLAGWHVTVCERAASLEPAGAALALAPNGLRALDAISAGDGLRGLAVPQEVGIRRSDGRWLTRSTTGRMISDRFGDPVILLPRTAVIDALAARVPDGMLSLATEVTSVEPGGKAGHGETAARRRRGHFPACRRNRTERGSQDAGRLYRRQAAAHHRCRPLVPPRRHHDDLGLASRRRLPQHGGTADRQARAGSRAPQPRRHLRLATPGGSPPPRRELTAVLLLRQLQFVIVGLLVQVTADDRAGGERAYARQVPARGTARHVTAPARWGRGAGSARSGTWSSRPQTAITRDASPPTCLLLSLREHHRRPDAEFARLDASLAAPCVEGLRDELPLRSAYLLSGWSETNRERGQPVVGGVGGFLYRGQVGPGRAGCGGCGQPVSGGVGGFFSRCAGVVHPTPLRAAALVTSAARSACGVTYCFGLRSRHR
jgi:hypothetical protein